MSNFKSIFFSFLTMMIMSSCNFGSNEDPTKEANASEEPENFDKNSELEKAPDFTVETIDGRTVSLERSMKENRPTVVYFTASWCPMCAKNWPAISEVYPEYKNKLNFVAVSIDPTDDKKVMSKLAGEKGFEFPVAAGNPQLMLDFGVESQATTVGINEEGYVEFQKDKTVLTADEYRSLFEKLLN